jgi:Mrp family chromosome partitioning ATPase/capsular polysaccharide biosynthesis protein
MSDPFSLQQSKPTDPNAPKSHQDSGEMAWDVGAASAAQQPESTDDNATQSTPSAAQHYQADTHTAGLQSPPEPLNTLDDLDELDELDDAPNPLAAIDLVGLLWGCWRRRYLVAAIATTITGLFLFIALTQVKHTWTAYTTLIKLDNAEEFIIGEGKSYQPKRYNRQTLLDTLKLPSSLNEVMRRSKVESRITTFAVAIGANFGENSEILQLKITWDDPYTAALITNNLSDVFLERSIDIQRREAEDSFDYYSAQLAEARQQRRMVDAEVLAFQRDKEISNLDTEITVRLGTLATLESDYQAQKSHVTALTSSITKLQADIAVQPDMVIKSTIYRSPLKQRQTDYQWELREARSRYTPDNPKVQKLQQKINVLSRMIGDSNDESVPENTYAPNAHRQDLKLVLYQRENDIKVAQANTTALETSIAAMQQKLALLNQAEKEYLRLKNRQQGSIKLERGLNQRIDESRIQMLRNEAAFDVLEPATPPEEPNPSARKMLAVGGTVLGLGLGLVIALLLELLEPLVRTRRDGSRLAGTEFCLEWAHHNMMPHRATAEAATANAQLFRAFGNDLDASFDPAALQSLAVVSVEPDTGHAQVAAQLALTLASKERRTLLINSDSSQLTVDKLAPLCGAIKPSPGLIDVLLGRCKLSSALQPCPIKHLQYLGIGAEDSSQEANSAIAGQRMEKLVYTLKSLHGRVIYLLAPLENNEAGLEIAAAISSVILVMRSGHSRRQQIAHLVEKLQMRNIQVIAALVIDVPAQYLEQRPEKTSSNRWHKKLLGYMGNGHAS